jgi:hypothetical protein
MAGGLMNLVSQGQQNIILNGNPSKTFWKTSYKKYTNFGMQKFRLDYSGSTFLRLTEESTFTFKVSRYGDLLMDTYLTINLPNIWSPVLPPQPLNQVDASGNELYSDWAPYEFKWIENLGSQMISKITVNCGNQKLQEFSGQYLLAMVQRDFSTEKKILFDQMSGNSAEFNDPANYGARVNSYPNAFYTDNPAGAEPSIRGTTLYIPLNLWFNLKSQMAFPLVALQYNQLEIQVTIRPIYELFVIRDVYDVTNNFPYVQPNFNQYYMQMYRFLQTPPDIELGPTSYLDTRGQWDTDVHLTCTYAFLSNDEQKMFAKNEQKYLIRQVQETTFYNVTGPNKIELNSVGLVSGWMWHLQRSDVNLRNQWSNYTNWPYNYLPNDIILAPTCGEYALANGKTIGPGMNPDGSSTGLFITGVYTLQNTQEILLTLGISIDGQYRENMQPCGVYNFVEKYTRTSGNAPNFLYCYNFSLNTSPFDLQPSGAINMNRFTLIEFEFTTVVPPLDPYAQVLTICDPQTGDIIGINKPTWRIYEYNYNLVLFEERINIVTFIGGNCGLDYAT